MARDNKAPRKQEEKDGLCKKLIAVNRVTKDFHLGIAISKVYCNEYNEDIARQRIGILIKKTIKYCEVNDVKKLHLLINGDLINGYKYLSLIADKDMSVVESVTRSSEIISEMITELCKKINNVDLYFTVGNHANMKQIKDTYKKRLPLIGSLNCINHLILLFCFGVYVLSRLR